MIDPVQENKNELINKSDSVALIDPLLGVTLANRFRIDELIGTGASGSVYRAFHLTLSCEIAVKVLHSHLANDPKKRARFELEARSLNEVNSPYVVKVLDYGVKPSPFIVMEYFCGQTLDRVMKTRGCFSADEAATLFLQLAEGLQAAHKVGLIHRDLKPSNIIVNMDADAIQVRILDFGIAKLLDDVGGSSNTSKLTSTGELIGSPPYMSPEQWSESKIDARLDIYSLACVMYEVLTGKPPFEASNAIEYMNKHLFTSPPAFSTVSGAQDVPPNLQKIVMKCLQKCPDDRYQSAQNLVADLHLLKSGKSVRLSLSSRRARIVKALALRTLVTALVGALLFFIWPFCKGTLLSPICQTANRDADQKLLKGQLSDAESSYRFCSTLASQINLQDRNNLHALRGLMKIYQERSEWPKATQLKSQIETIIGRVARQSKIGRLVDVARSQRAIGVLAAAESHAREAEAEARMKYGTHSMIYASVLVLLSQINVELEEHDKAIKNVDEALKISQDLLEPNDPLQARFYNDVAAIYSACGKTESLSEKYIRMAIAIQEMDRQSTQQLIASYVNLASSLIKQKKFAEALRYSVEALELQKQTQGNKDDIRILDKLAFSYAGLGKTSEAIEVCDKLVMHLKKSGVSAYADPAPIYELLAQLHMKLDNTSLVNHYTMLAGAARSTKKRRKVFDFESGAVL
ncbi:MAG: serine/threonine-protein kinase [Candidatus Obscuribacterales bacterium]|nr:serine/threonine-protein kinase [Candidatus Obscuribacterales bacterium]